MIVFFMILVVDLSQCPVYPSFAGISRVVAVLQSVPNFNLHGFEHLGIRANTTVYCFITVEGS